MDLEDLMEKLGVPPKLSEMEKQTINADKKAMHDDLSAWFDKYFGPRTAESKSEYQERIAAGISELTDILGICLCLATRGQDAGTLLEVTKLTGNRITAEAFDCFRSVAVGLALKKSKNEIPAEKPTFVMPGNGEIN